MAKEKKKLQQKYGYMKIKQTLNIKDSYKFIMYVPNCQL